MFYIKLKIMFFIIMRVFILVNNFYDSKEKMKEDIERII